jgi:hypothetical protein
MNTVESLTDTFNKICLLTNQNAYEINGTKESLRKSMI